MHFVGVVWICVVFCSCYQCAIVEIQEGNKMTGESSRLATNSADNAGNHDRNSQSDPRYLDDHSKQLNNLTEVQDGVLEQTVKEKRCKTEGIVGMPSLSLGRRDTTVNLLRKSCENCRSSVMCKSRGKCEGCKKICDRFEIAMESADEVQMDGPSDENSDQTEILGVENRIGDTVQDQKGLSYGENPYYTVGSFPPGPVHSLLAKLLNIKDAEPIEQLLILAKTKLTRPINSVRPVVIDTAHIFTLNQGGPSKLDVEVHEVKGNSGNINSIASELDREIEKAMEEKRKISGGASRLAPNEIDRIILNAIGQDPKKAPNKPARNMNGLDWDETAARNSDDDTDVGQNFKKQKINQSIPSATSDHQFQRLTGQHRPLEEDTLSQQIPPHLKSGSLAHPPMISSPATQYTDVELSRSNEEEQLVKLEPGDEKTEDVVASEAIEATTIKHKQFPIGPSQNNPRGPKKPRVTSPAPPLTWKYPHGPKESGGIRTTTIFTTIDPKRFPVGPEIGRSNDDSDESSEHEGFTEIPTTIKYKHFPMGPSQNNPRGPKKPRVTSPVPPLTWKYPHGPKESGGIRTTTIFTTIDPKRFPVGPEIGRSNDDTDESSEYEGFTEIPTTIKYKHFPMGPSQNNPRGPKKPRVTSLAPPLTWKYPHGPKESGGIRTTTIFTTMDPKRFPVGPEIGRSNDDSDESSEHEGFTEIPTTIKYKHFPMGPSQNNPRGPKKPRVTSPAPPLTWKYPHGPKESGGIRTTTIFTTIDPKRFPVGPEIGRSNDDSDESSEHEGFTEIPTTPETVTVPFGPPNENKGTQELMNSRMMEVADFKKVPARYIVGKKQDASRTDSDIDDVEILKDKYNKLQEWVMRNSQISPPALQDPFLELQEETGNQLAGNVKDIIDSASKINKKISSIVKTDARNPGLVQMVRENDDRLRAMDDDNEHIIGFPNMNKFKTKITPETQRKIDQIFANERPLGSVRKMKDPYEFHPRQESKYRDGTWVYEKIKPNKPPYSTRHRTSTAWKDQQILDGNASNEKSRNSAPTYVDPKLLNMDSVIKGLNNTPRMYYDKANRMLGVEQSESRETHTLHKDIKPIMTSRHRQSEQEGMQADESPATVNEDQESQKNITQEIPGNIQDHDSTKTGSAEGESYEGSSETKNKSNETVACSKEEEEEMLEVLHLHPMSYGGYRSSEHDGSTDRHPNQASGKIKHLNLAKEVLTPTNDNLQSQHPLKHIADQTEKMIDSLNKMHKHGKTIPDDIPKYQARNEGDNVKDEEQLIPFQEPLIQPGYFSPQSPSFAPMRTASEMAQESMDPNFMEQPMLFGPNTNNMEQEFIGVPAMGNRMQKPYSDLTHMGKFIPRDRERRLSLHSRDVSEQEKSKNMYFIGDGIKLPLNMKEHNDGSLHLSVDVKSLCNCKHCRSKQFENGTIILEAMPLTEKEREEHEEEMKTNKALERNTDEDDERGKTTKNRDDSEEHVMYVDAGENLEDKKIDLAFYDGDDKVDLSKRSARTKNSLKDNEIDSSIYSASEEDPVIPLKRLSRQEILDRLAEIKETEKDLGNDHMKLEINNSGNHHDDGNENKMDTKFNLISNVLDFMKKVTLDVRSKK